MNISTLRKTMLVTMEAIEDPDSISEEERERNKQAACVDSDAAYDECSATAAKYCLAAYDECSATADAANASYADAYAAYWTTHAAARAAVYVYIGNYEMAQEWINEYFETTGENKQDYINHIKREK